MDNAYLAIQVAEIERIKIEVEGMKASNQQAISACGYPTFGLEQFQAKANEIQMFINTMYEAR